MTAEVAILNRSAVALAADSTVTIGDGDKTYSVNKLFTLSKIHPIGVMIYGDAAFMDVPWETLIKQYRRHLGDESFPRVRDYATHMLRYVENLQDVLAEDDENRHFAMMAFGVIGSIRDDVDRQVERESDGGKPLAESDIKAIVLGQIKEWREYADGSPLLPCADEGFVRELYDRYRDVVGEILSDQLGAFNLAHATLEEVALIACRRIASGAGASTGVVVAGFGDKDIFPAIKTMRVYGKVAGKILYKENDDESDEISATHRAQVLPFAQKDVVFAFLTGCEGSYLGMVESMFDEFFASFPQVTTSRVAAIISKLDDAQRAKLVEEIGGDIQKIKQDFFTIFSRYRNEKHVEPLFDVIGALPKDELALLAEALVNLTSVKRKVSTGRETVGGPIDVAVISKGDGFVWINRKHYFRPEINPHFMETYFRR